MDRRSVEAVIRALNEANVRYLVVGGLAVVAHGYLRYTADMDLILDLAEDNLRKAVAALAGEGYRPQVPVPLEQFVDPVIRSGWVRDKQLTVLSLFSEKHPSMVLDLFVEAPLDFQQAFAAASRMKVGAGLDAPIASIDDLLTLKERANRPKDQEDMRVLKILKEKLGNG